MNYRALVAVVLALCLSLLTACGESASVDRSQLTYDQIKDTGLANLCPEIAATSRGSIPLDPSKSYKLTALCLQPNEFYVKQEPISKRQTAQYVPAKLVTRETSSIDQVEGKLKVNADGSLTFIEQDGFDFQPATVQLPGREQFPLLFTIKELVATTQPGLNAVTTSTDFEGSFKVPSYRTSNFLDPKGRGLTAGYDNAIALPARADSEELVRENVKSFDVNKGTISLQVTKVDSATGEIAGNFISEQPSETDMGSKEPSEIKIIGVFYGRIESAA
jgi:photosystem II oxygen-evolving enhancer protein 1